MDQRIEEDFPPFLYEAGKEVSLSEMLQARRRAGSTLANNDDTERGSHGDLSNQQQGVSNLAADDDNVNSSQANGEPLWRVVHALKTLQKVTHFRHRTYKCSKFYK